MLLKSVKGAFLRKGPKATERPLAKLLPVVAVVLAWQALGLAPGAEAASVPKLGLAMVNSHGSLSITGDVGSVCTIQCLTNLAPPQNWQVLGTVELTNSPQAWTDTNAHAGGRCFYRTLLQPLTSLKYSYGTSQMGQSLVYYKLTPSNPSGKKALLNYEVHGFEDAWAHDGYGLIAIANLVKAYYLTNPAALNGWTVYLNPSANPDGVKYGTNAVRELTSGKVAFGRCTLNGRDINRNFSQGTSAEQVALATLVTSVAPTIILDFHGWCDCYYAENYGTNVGKYFYDAFNASYAGKPSQYGYVNYSGTPDGTTDWGTTVGTTFHANKTMTSDMFAEWANRVKNIPAAIIEYPAPRYSAPGTAGYDTVYDPTLGVNVISPTIRDSLAERTEVALNNLFANY